MNKICTVCGNECIPTGCTTGYGTNSKGEILCFQCCGWGELAAMRDTGKTTLYLTENTRNRSTLGCLSNWPGTFEIAGYVRKGKHNMAGSRYDVWFSAFGREWHGVQYGDNTQLCHCRALKD